MDTKLPTAQEAAIGFAKRLRPQDLAEVIDFDSRVVVLQNFTNNAAELEQAIRKTSAGGSTSLYNAVYIALKDLKKVVAKNADEIRRQAIVVLSDGEDTSSLLPFEEVLDLAKRSETAIYAIGLRVDRRPGIDDARASRKPSSSCGSSRRKPAAARSSRISWPSCASVYGQISDELSSQYTVGYTSRNPRARRRLAPRRRPRRPAERDRADQAGLLRADRVPSDHEPRSAGALRRRASWPTPGTSRGATPAVGRSATTLLVAGALAHTFVIGMQTMEVGHVPVAGATSAISTFVWLLALVVPLHRDDHRRARDGRLHPAAARRAADDSGVQPGRRGPRGRCCRVRCSASTCRRCCSPTPASRWPA